MSEDPELFNSETGISRHTVHWDEKRVHHSLKRSRYDDISVTDWRRLDDMLTLAHVVLDWRFEICRAVRDPSQFIAIS